MKIQFLGGVRTVTGTCFYLSTSELRMLVDCGMFQGADSDKINRAPFFFNPSEIDCLFLTHAHIDHIGLVPKLVKDGFRGRIITTSATADLSELMLYDSAHIQESDAEWQTRRALRSGRKPEIPFYTVDDVRVAMPLFQKSYYGKVEHLERGIRYRFLDAGHILGSGTLELWYQDSLVKKKIIFSGDIGRKGNPIVRDPSTIEETDYVIVESTYGNRQHKGMKETVDELVEAIRATFKRGGNVLIPAFAIGRTQDLLYTLNKLVREGGLYKINVYIDSPLAEEATKAYLAHPECFDEEAKRLFNQNLAGDAIKLHFTNTVEESQALNRIKSGAIIIAGSGMCEGGRIRHHLKHNLWRSECSVIFVGFQASGTLGRRIIDGAEKVRIFGEEIAVKARVYTIGGFSAHADQTELLEWLGAFKNNPEVFVVHGEEKISLEFESIIKERYGFKTHVPSKGDIYEI